MLPIILYILLGIVLLVVILAIVAPKSYDVHRSILIDKPKEMVFDHVKLIRNHKIWSPWNLKDPNMTLTYEGTDGEEGFISRWEGNKDVGAGYQTVINIVPNERMDNHLVFLKPWKSESNGYYIFEDAAPGQTKMTWGFKGKNKFPATLFMLLYNMDKVVGKEFKEGLQTLKNHLEEV